MRLCLLPDAPPMSPPDPGLLSTFVPNTDCRSGLLLHFGASCQGSEQSVDDRSVRLTVKGGKACLTKELVGPR